MALDTQAIPVGVRALDQEAIDPVVNRDGMFASVIILEVIIPVALSEGRRAKGEQQSEGEREALRDEVRG